MCSRLFCSSPSVVPRSRTRSAREPYVALSSLRGRCRPDRLKVHARSCVRMPICVTISRATGQALHSMASALDTIMARPGVNREVATVIDLDDGICDSWHIPRIQSQAILGYQPTNARGYAVVQAVTLDVHTCRSITYIQGRCSGTRLQRSLPRPCPKSGHLGRLGS